VDLALVVTIVHVSMVNVFASTALKHCVFANFLLGHTLSSSSSQKHLLGRVRMYRRDQKGRLQDREDVTLRFRVWKPPG
jgi:hypothetical protein